MTQHNTTPDSPPLDTSPFCTTVPSEKSNSTRRKKEPAVTSTNTQRVAECIIDTSTQGLPPGYETEETSQAKNTAYEILEYDYIPDSGDAITAADRVVEALIKAGWRPTVEEPAAEHVEGEQAGPMDAEVRAAAEAIARCTFPDKGWWELSPWKREYNTKRARAALVAARKAAQR